LFEQAVTPPYAYFLLSGLASIGTSMENAESAQVGFIGTESVVGSSHLLGPASLPTRCIIQLLGSSLRIPFLELQDAFDNSHEIRACILNIIQKLEPERLRLSKHEP
jgi:CRP-like cAMP-binding protein